MEKAKVLVVDDNLDVLRTIADVLEAKGFHVVAAESGLEAIDQVKKADFDVALLDIVMPEINGVHTFKEIKKISPRTKVIMMTGYSVDDRIREAIEEGALEVIHKPLNLEELTKLIESIEAGFVILVVDDDLEFCQGMKDVLEGKGYQVAIAGEGQQAINMAKETQYDILFIDMKLPTINGLETYLAIRELNPRAAAIMMTAYWDETKELVQEAITKSAITCLYKPFDMDEVVNLVEDFQRARMEPQVNLLIVDDDEALCQTLCDIFQELGFGADTALNSEEALKKCAARYFNIALIDIGLPDFDGLELLNRLKKANPDLEGIIMTAYPSLETVVEAMRRGAINYVTKPLQVDEVLHTVSAALEKQRLSVEEKRRLEQEIKAKEFYRSISIIDELTGLYNYRHFHELLTQELSRSRRYFHPLSLLMIDIDNFKEYQDAYDHSVGDAALKVIAQTTRNTVRGVDIVARYGGDEFAVISPEATKADAAAVAERVRNAVAETILPTGDRLTISIGVASYPTDAQDKEQLICWADQALYRAKQGGRNQICIWEQWEAKTSKTSSSS
jgi:diguanylate cyclase (GGDEF)-like protein